MSCSGRQRNVLGEGRNQSGRYSEVGVLHDNFFFKEYTFFRVKFMLTVSHNHGNPMVYNVYR